MPDLEKADLRGRERKVIDRKRLEQPHLRHPEPAKGEVGRIEREGRRPAAVVDLLAFFGREFGPLGFYALELARRVH